jgi:integrase
MSKLTDAKLKAAKPLAKQYKVADGQGLCILVMPDGSKHWRFRYRYASRERMISLGCYPEVSLRDARAKHSELRSQVLSGLDPAKVRRDQKVALRTCEERTFGAAANDWYNFKAPSWRPETAKKARAYLDKDILPRLGRLRLRDVTSRDLASLVESIEKRGAFNVAKKTRRWLHGIFVRAIARGLTSTNPAEFLSGLALPSPESRPMAHLPFDELAGFLSAVTASEASVLVKAAIGIAVLTAARPGVLRTMRWDEIDLVAGLWVIPKGRKGMKLGYEHITPLPKQAVMILEEIKKISGSFDYVFIGRNDPEKPMSENAISAAIRRLGFEGRQTAHGFRHLVSTALNERNYSKDWIERQLAHGDPDKIRGTYNEAHYIDQRRAMMQTWADEVMPIRHVTRMPHVSLDAPVESCCL